MAEKDTLAWVERTLALPVYADPAPDSYGEGVRDTLRTVARLMRAEHTARLIDRSSFGDADVAEARESVSDEKARDLVERSKRGGQNHPNRSAISEHLARVHQNGSANNA